MNTSNRLIIYAIFAFINILHLIGFSIITLLATFATNYFILNITAIIVFLIINLIVYGLLYFVAEKFKWNIWVNLLVSFLAEFIYIILLLITGMLLAFPYIDNLESPTVY